MKRMIAKKWFVLVVVLFGVHTGFSQNIFGKWKTIDDKTGKPKAIVNLFKKGGLMYGEILKVLEKGREDAVCIKCEGNKKDKPIEGLEIIEGLQEDGRNTWKGDTLLDPENGTTYRCKIWLNPENSNELKVRGYVAFLYRTQTWIRVDG